VTDDGGTDGQTTTTTKGLSLSLQLSSWLNNILFRIQCERQTVWDEVKETYHRLNGRASPVLTATSLSYGKTKNSTPHRIKTPDLIEIKFGTVDYAGEVTPHAKFHVNPSKGGFPANG